MSRHTGRRAARAIAVASAAVLVAGTAACGSGSGGDSGGGEPDTFRFAYSYDLPTFDPLNMTNPIQVVYLFPVYDRLVHLSPDSQPIPGLAESWEVSDDALTLTMHLRSGVTFSDGEVFDSAAAKTNIDRYRTSETSSVAPLMTAIESIDTPDENTLVLHLSEPDATLIDTFAERGGMMISPKAIDGGELDTKPVGAGQYTLESHQANDRVIYERRDDYWNTEVQGEQTLEIRIMSDATARANALTSNEVDAASSVGLSQATQFADNDAFTVDVAPTTNYYSFIFSDDIFKDVSVREAVALAIDRDSVVDAVLQGYGEPTAQPWAPGTPAYNDAVEVEYAPEKSKELLAEAGYPDGFEFEAIVPMVDPAPKLAEALQQMLGEVGITMTITQLDAAQIVDNFFVQGQGGAYVGSTGGQASPLLMVKQTWLPTSYYAPLHLDSPEVVDLYESANAEPDPEKRVDTLQELTAAIHDEWLTVPIATNIAPIVVSDRVQGYEHYSSGLLEFPNVTVSD